MNIVENNSAWGQFVDLDNFERGEIYKSKNVVVNKYKKYMDIDDPDYYYSNDEYNFSPLDSLDTILTGGSVKSSVTDLDKDDKDDKYPSINYRGYLIVCYWGDKVIKTGFVVWLVYALFM
jgi:hypothetical protein